MQLDDAIHEFLEGYFATHDRSPKTKKAYAIDLRQFADFLGREKDLEDITPDVLEAWAKELRDRDYQPTSMRRKFASLKVFVRYWLRKASLESSPFDRVFIEFGKARLLPRHLTECEAKALLRAAHDEVNSQPDTGPRVSCHRFEALRSLAILEILLLTGIRVGELTALRLGDWQESISQLLIRGKGNKERLVPVSGAISFSRYLMARRQIRADSDLMFLNRSRRPYSTQSVAAMLRRVSRLARIEKRVTPHMLRHTAATLLLQNGAALRVVQSLLGHRSITTTQRYTHVSQGLLHEQVSEFHPLLSRPTDDP